MRLNGSHHGCQRRRCSRASKFLVWSISDPSFILHEVAALMMPPSQSNVQGSACPHTLSLGADPPPCLHTDPGGYPSQCTSTGDSQQHLSSGTIRSEESEVRTQLTLKRGDPISLLPCPGTLVDVEEVPGYSCCTSSLCCIWLR